MNKTERAGFHIIEKITPLSKSLTECELFSDI